MLEDDTSVLLEDEACLLLEMLEDVTGVLLEDDAGLLLDELPDALLEWLVLVRVLDWLLLLLETAVLMLTALVERLLLDVEGVLELE